MKEGRKSVQTKFKIARTRAHTNPCSGDQANIPVIPLNVVRGRSVAICTMCRTQTEQGCGNCPGCGACQNRAPPHGPRLFNSPAHKGCLLSGTCLCPLAQERSGFAGHATDPQLQFPGRLGGPFCEAPTSSGYVRSFLRRALCETTHQCSPHLCVGIRHNGERSPLWRRQPTDIPQTEEGRPRQPPTCGHLPGEGHPDPSRGPSRWW